MGTAAPQADWENKDRHCLALTWSEFRYSTSESLLLYVQFAAQEENAEHNNDRQQLTNNNDIYYNYYNSQCADAMQRCDDAM